MTWETLVKQSLAQTIVAKLDFKQNYFIPLSHWQAINCTGDNAQQFLQGQLTCDVKQINAQQASLAATCNQKGRVFSLFYLGFMNQQYTLILPQANVENSLQELHPFAQLSRANLSVADEIVAGILIDAKIIAKEKYSEKKYIIHEINGVFLINLSTEKPLYLVVGSKHKVADFVAHLDNK
ncbi:MAG: hypothetical protein AAGG80_07265, partial [Pseudomonadota bacterium]